MVGIHTAFLILATAFASTALAGDGSQSQCYNIGYNSGVNDGWNDVCQAGYVAKISGGEYNPYAVKYSGKATHGIDSSCNAYSDNFMKGYSKGYEGELASHQSSIYNACYASKASAAGAQGPLFKPKNS